MRRLYISIIVTVVSSIFFISWGLDNIFAKHDVEETPNEYAFFHQLIEGFDQQLSQQPELQLTQFSQQLAIAYQVELTLDKANNIALPQELSSQLSQQGGLLLASETQPYLLKQLSQYPQYIVQLSLPIALNENHKINILLTTLLYLGVCAIVLAWLFPLTRRLYLLTETAAKIGAGDLAARMPASKLSYITNLESRFNRMAAQIEKLVADNKILARSMSHDIRTPMSCLRFGVEAALDTPTLEKKNHYLERMETELTRMEDMTTAFLEYAGMERQGFQLKYEQINIEQLLTAINQDFQSLAEQHNVTLTYQADKKTQPAVMLNLDYHWCYRAIQNLLSNAMQYAQNQIVISTQCKQNCLYINVEDDGKGIAEENMNSVFEPFVKLDEDRSRELGHFGLGLAITTKVIHWHQGSISVKNNVNLTGACFTIALPFNTHRN